MSIAFIPGRVWMGFSAFQKSQEPTLWRTRLTLVIVGVIAVYHAICIRLSILPMVITNDFHQGRKAFLMTPLEFWLTLPVYIWMAESQGLRFKFFGTVEPINYQAILGIGNGFEDQNCSPKPLLDLRFVWENLKKNRSWGRGQSP